MLLRFVLLTSFFLFPFYTIHILQAECGISNPVITNSFCIENASYSFDINFNVSDPSLDSFDIDINEIFYGRFSVLNLPISIVQTNYADTIVDIIKISDPKNSDCFAIIETVNPCPCAIFNFKHAVHQCTDSTFNIILDFQHIASSDIFLIGMIGQNFGEHKYDDLPISIGPFESKDTSYTINIIDFEEIFCLAEYSFDASAECVDCSIEELTLEHHECKSGELYLMLSFHHKNVQSDEFTVKAGTGKLHSYKYKNKIVVDSVTIKEIFVLGPIGNECGDEIKISVWDSENESCADSIVIEQCCKKDCEIGDIYVKELVCDSDSTYEFILRFAYKNNKSDTFYLNVNNQIKGYYSVEQLPLKISGIKSDGDKKHFLEICMDDGLCCSEIEYDAPECERECVINEILVKEIECTSATEYQFWLNFRYQDNESDIFHLNVNDQIKGFYNISDLPLKVTGIKTDQSLESFVEICMDSFECCKKLFYEAPDCQGLDCRIFNGKHRAIFDTLEQKFWIMLEFEYENTSESFSIKGNGIDYGIFKYRSLPFFLGPYSCKDELFIKYEVSDAKYDKCSYFYEAGRINCPSTSTQDIGKAQNWQIYKALNDNLITIISESENTSNASFELFNTVGQMLLQKTFADGLNTIEINEINLEPGLYIGKFTSNQKVFSRKLLFVR